MCGICGIVAPDGASRNITRDLVVRMRDSMIHRGPDAEGEFIDTGVGLGHRRLSIVDVARGQQPMFNDNRSLVMVYNGEVYNHPELSAALQGQGVRYHTHCDTETVLRIFERERERTPMQLRGMFTFAIWDRERRELFLARDRFGVKPLYYVHADDGTLFFASEIKALIAAGAVRPSINVSALPDYLANHATSGDETLFQGVRRLPPGHTLRWRAGKIVVERYWDLTYGDGEAHGTADDRELIAEYGERLRDAVRMRLMADVPLGVFLSGGIDSAAITALMSQLVAEPIKTFSVAFAEREANELVYARSGAKRFATDHHEVLVSPEEFFAALPRLIWHEDEPIAHPSSVALWFVSRLAAERVKVVLTGEGSDETLAGYGRYRKTVYNLRFGRAYEAVSSPWMRRAVRAGITRMPLGPRTRQKLARTFLCLPSRLDALYLENFAVFSSLQQRSLLAPELRDQVAGLDPYAVANRLFEQCDAPSLLNRLLYVDTKTYLHELLMKQDQMSMAASIESRVPFLDHPLVEFASRLPERLKLRGVTTKYVLRQAMRGVLPPEILTRRKMGFPVPIGSWLRGRYSGLLDEFVLGERVRARGLFEPSYVNDLVNRHRAGEDHTERLWALVNVEMWQRMHLDGEAPEAVRVP
jgi:asparagine synthase (glutamine-hydrolysing)